MEEARGTSPRPRRAGLDGRPGAGPAAGAGVGRDLRRAPVQGARAPLHRPLRRPQRPDLDQPRGRRRRLPGLDRDADADVHPLGREPPLQGRGPRPDARRPGRPQGRDPAGPGAPRLRTAALRARRPPAGPDLALRPEPPPPHLLRAGRDPARAGGGGDGRHNRPRRPPDRHLPLQRRRRPARQQDRVGDPDHPHPDRDRGHLPERALPDQEPRDRDEDAARPALRSPADAGGQADRRPQGPDAAGRVRLPDPQLHPAALHPGEGRPYRRRGGKRSSGA